MPLSPSMSRALRHTRAIQVEAFERDDGLWDLDAHLADTKTRDVPFPSGLRPAGEPVHALCLRLTIDREFNIVAVEAVSDSVPYQGFCDAIAPDYSKLVGLNLAKGFRAEARQRLGGKQGCTHLTELAQILPTVAFQAFAGIVLPMLDAINPDQQNYRPFQLDGCHGLRSDGGAVARYYPRWAIKSGYESDPS